MPQTIAAQRGTATVTANGVTATTLWTQSTGIATRVILNSVVTKHAAGANSRVALLLNVNGTGNYACVAIRCLGSTPDNTYGMIMMPGSNAERMTTTAYVTTAYTNFWIPYSIASSGAYLFGNLENTRWRMLGPNATELTSTAGSIDIVPSQFWMNSGDSLIALCYNSTEASTTMLYSFTTITES